MFGRMIATTSIFIWIALLAGAQMSLTQKAGISVKQQSEEQQEADLLAIVLDKGVREKEPQRLVRAIERLGEMRSVAAINLWFTC